MPRSPSLTAPFSPFPYPCSSACLIPENSTAENVDTFDGQHPLQASFNDYLQIPPSISHKPDLALYTYQYCQALMRRHFFLLPVSANKPRNFLCTSNMALAATSASSLYSCQLNHLSKSSSLKTGDITSLLEPLQ